MTTTRHIGSAHYLSKTKTWTTPTFVDLLRLSDGLKVQLIAYIKKATAQDRANPQETAGTGLWVSSPRLAV